jgi:CRP-like cAMP-binding protein
MQAVRVRAEDVAAIGIFEGLGREALEDCARHAVRRALPRRLLVFAQGEPCARFQALLSGGIRISQGGAEGGQALIRFVGPGEPFGSFGMFVDGCYPAEANAVAASVELSWSKAQFHQLVERHPSVAMNLVTLAARRLAELQERLREITTLPAEQRIANALLRLSRDNGRCLSDGRVEIAWPLTRKDVADISATALHTASRVMARWERGGIIQSDRKRVTIESVAELTRIVESGA